jgi:AcrR family transcriptional regulator
MAVKKSKPAARKLRADAQRNRERILAAAKAGFTKNGAQASLDEIARRAKVGAGTLYRHFPTREALLEAVYQTEVEKLAAAQREFSKTLPPVEALRAWMLLFVDYIAAKQIISPALYTLLGASPKVFQSTGGLITGAIEALVGRAAASGEIRADINAMDLLRAVYGVSSVASTPDWPQSAKRLVDILIQGSRVAPL